MAGQKFVAKYGVDVKGDILVSGLVDGIDIAAFKTTYDNHNHTLSSLSEKSYLSLTNTPTVGDGSFTEKNFTTTLFNKLNNIEALADVTDATNVAAAGATMKSLFGANSILASTTAGNPASVAIAEGAIVGRIVGGNIASLTAAQVRTILNVADGADVTNGTNVTAAGAVMKSFYTAGTFLYATSNATPQAKTASEVRTILNIQDNANYYVHPNHTGEVTSVADGATIVSNNVIDADNLMGNSAALGAGTAGQALVAGSTSKRFAYVTLGAAAYKAVVTSIDSSANLPTSNAVMSYVDNTLANMGKVRPGVQAISDLKALTGNTDTDMVLVESVGLYRFDAQSSATGDDNLTVVPTSGGGRWFKMSSVINTHSNLDNIDKWGGISGNTYHVPNIDSNTAHFLRGDGTWATPPDTHWTHTGDVAGTTALTIQANVVSNTKLADMPNSTIKGRVTTGTGDPEDLTVTQVRTLLNVENGANNYTHPNDGAGSLSGLANAIVINGITVNALGHVTGTTTRTLTLANLGYTGATNANNYTHPNHSGDVTSVADGATTIVDNKIGPSKLKGSGSAALSNGSNNDYLQSAGDGTFKWGTVASPSQVDYAYGQSISFVKTAISTSNVVVDSFAKATYRSVKWILSIYDIVNSKYETAEIAAVHDGTNVYFNEYGNVFNSTGAGITFDVVINSANVELKAIGTSTNNTIKGIRNVVNV